MKGMGIGIFILILFVTLNSGNDLLGWEARARIEQQTQLQVATIQANAEIESIRLEQAAAMERAQVRARLIEKLITILPLTTGLFCGAVLLGMMIHYHWKSQLRASDDAMISSPINYLESRSPMLPPPSLPLLKISAGDLRQLQQQAQAANHRLDVVPQGSHQAALLIDNVSGNVQAERAFVIIER